MSFVHKKQFTLFDYVNYTLLLLISGVSVIPFIYVISVSLTASDAYVPFQFNFFPKDWSLEAYTYILKTDSFVNAFKNTVFITVVGTLFNLLFTFPMAYALTEKSCPHRNVVIGVVVFSLVFNAGIVPNYLLVKELGLINSYWALIIPFLTNAWSLIVVKSFMESLPSELKDAAKIDGCSDLGVFFKIIIPLSMPALAAFTLFFAVVQWNTYFNAVIYLTDSKKWTLQVLVKSLVIDDSSGLGGSMSAIGSDRVVPQETARLAAVVLSMLPILIIYPFLQKHFAKGVMLGSVKG